MSNARYVSPTAILVAIVTVVMVAGAAVLFVAYNDAGTQRLAMLIGIVGLVLPALIGMLRGDVAAARLDSDLDQRIIKATLAANYARRTSDVTPEAATPAGRETLDDTAVTAPIVRAGPEGMG